MQFAFCITYGRQCRRLTSYRENNIEKISVCERAERASLENFRVLYVPEVLFLSLFLLVLRIFCRYDYIFVGYFCYICTFNAVSLLLLAACHYNINAPYTATGKTPKTRKSMCALKIFSFFIFQKSYFFHYFCWNLGYFVGMTCLLVTCVCYFITRGMALNTINALNKLPAKHLQRENLCVRASRVSELGGNFAFTH